MDVDDSTPWSGPARDPDGSTGRGRARGGRDDDGPGEDGWPGEGRGGEGRSGEGRGGEGRGGEGRSGRSQYDDGSHEGDSHDGDWDDDAWHDDAWHDDGWHDDHHGDGWHGDGLGRRRRAGSLRRDARRDDSGRRGSRRWVFLLAAAVPWLAVGAFLLGRDGGSAEDPGVAPSAAARTDGTAGAAPGPGATTGAPDPLVLDTGARVAVGRGEIAAAAVPVARAWITGIGPTLSQVGFDPSPARFADHLAVEAVDLPAPGAAVVSLLAVTLVARGGDYEGVEVRRLAVPLRVGADGIAPAGPPWWLPGPDLAVQALEDGEDLTDPDLLVAAGAAVAAAGYREVEVVSLETTGAWPLAATVTAVAPGEAGAATHVLWLRRHLDRLVLAGTRPEAATTPATAEDSRGRDDGSRSPSTPDDP